MTFDGDGCVRTLRRLGMRLVHLTTTSVALSYPAVCVSAKHLPNLFSETVMSSLPGSMQDTLPNFALPTIDVPNLSYQNAHHSGQDHAICFERQYSSTKRQVQDGFCARAIEALASLLKDAKNGEVLTATTKIM